MRVRDAQLVTIASLHILELLGFSGTHMIRVNHRPISALEAQRQADLTAMANDF